MLIDTQKYDSWIKRHRKLIIALWISIFIVSLPFAPKLFSVVSYNITGSSNYSHINGSASNSSLQQIVIVVQSQNIYSNSSKIFLTDLVSVFPQSHVTSIYTSENASLSTIYALIYNYAAEAKAAYLRAHTNQTINSTVLSGIASSLYAKLSVSIFNVSGGKIIAGPSLSAFVNGVVRGYYNSTPQQVYLSHNFPDYPLMPASAIVSQLVNPTHNTTVVTMSVRNYSNASSTINSLAKNNGVKVYITGAQVIQNSIESSTLSGTLIAIVAGLFLAIIITGVIFKSPIAAFVPFLIFMVDIIISYSLFYFIFHFILNTSIFFFDPVLTSILMLGLSTDYIIYILYRYKQERISGQNQQKAAASAFNWAGSAVFVSGLTVISAYIVLSLFALPFIGRSGTLNAVGISVVLLSALTFLPAILHSSGDKLMRFNGKGSDSIGSVFDRIGKFDRKHAKKIIALFVAASVACFYVFITVTPGFNILGLLPNSSTKSAFYVSTNNFGYDPLDPILFTLQGGKTPPINVTTVLNTVKSTPGVYSVIPVESSSSSYNIYLKNLAFNRQAINTYNSINSYLASSGVKYKLNGTVSFLAAAYNPINGDIYPLMTILGIVIFTIISIILFSIVTPLRLVLMLVAMITIANALTIFVFYVVLSLPFIIFAQVFLITNMMGVGVDYDIFLVMRIREYSKRGYKNADAVREGLSKSGPVIISIGVILASVFFGLSLTGIPLVAEIGFIVGTGILLDTFLSILIIIPSFMFILSRYNWWPSAITK